MKNRGKRRYPAPLHEYESRFLIHPGRSVNRKVQGSNPCSGAKSEFESSPKRGRQAESSSSFVAICSNWQIGFRADPG